MELFVDTETSGMILWGKSLVDKRQPWMVQLGAILSEKDIVYAEVNLLIKSEGRKISAGAFGAHNISTEMADKAGVKESITLGVLEGLIEQADIIVCHNVNFDIQILLSVARKAKHKKLVELLDYTDAFCTMKETTGLCKLPGGKRGDFKWPKLQELHMFLFEEPFMGAHDAINDVRATRRCYYELKRREDDRQAEEAKRGVEGE